MWIPVPEVLGTGVYPNGRGVSDTGTRLTQTSVIDCRVTHGVCTSRKPQSGLDVVEITLGHGKMTQSKPGQQGSMKIVIDSYKRSRELQQADISNNQAGLFETPVYLTLSHTWFPTPGTGR